MAEGSNQEEYSGRDVVKGDAWFGSVTAAAELAKAGKDCCLQVNQNSGLYSKKFI